MTLRIMAKHCSAECHLCCFSLMLSVTCVKCQKQTLYAECRCVKCHNAECRGAISSVTNFYAKKIKL